MKLASLSKYALVGTLTAASLASAGWVGGAFALDDSKWLEGLPKQHKSKHLVHDTRRKQPTKVTPGERPENPPSDAVVLFDGKDQSKWIYAGGKKGGEPAAWNVENGYMELNNTGSIKSTEAFGDSQIHLEFRCPSPPEKRDQARGNSGVICMGHYEVQVLDNADNVTYPDGTVGAVYGQHPPLVNASKNSGEWQTYDIIFRRPRFKGKTDEVVEPARVTAFLNGVLVQHNAEVFGRVAWRKRAQYKYHGDALPLLIQDHGDRQKMRFRNVWVRRLDLSSDRDE